MKRYIFISSIFLLFFSVDSSYSQNSSEIPKAWHKKGETLTSFFGVSLYNGTLFAPVDKPFNIDGNYALSLSYLRSFKVKTLIKSTIKEIDRIQGMTIEEQKNLSNLLFNCFVNVSKGDRITAIAIHKNEISFFYNGKKQCDLEMANIRRKFFSIWLGNNTRDFEGSLRLQGL